MTTEGMSPADIAAVTGNNNGCMFGEGNGGAWWIIILFLFAFCGGWGNGWGGNGGAFGGGVSDGYVLASDFATLQRQIDSSTQSLERKGDSLSNGLCDGFFDVARQFNGVNTNILTQGNATNMAMMQGFNGLQSQIAQCCCDNRYDMAMNINGLSRDVERGFCNTNFNLQNEHCQTMQAIDKVGDRVIDYLAQHEAQNLRDENQALRLAMSQSNQNNVLINALKPPCPIPAFTVPNPYQYNNNCGCGC